MILITGATGNNGRELVRQLVAAGQRVRALVRNPAKAAELKGPNVELAVGEFDHPETLDAALRGVDKAFLLTPVAEHFVEWQSAFIEAAERAELKHLVKFSGMGAESNAEVELLRPSRRNGQPIAKFRRAVHDLAAEFLSSKHSFLRRYYQDAWRFLLAA